MSAMVRSERRASRSAPAQARRSSGGPWPSTSAVRSAASRTPVPVADNQLRVNTAGSAAADATTGGTRSTRLWSPATLSLGAEIALRRFFTEGSPQRNTSTVRMIQGAHARAMGPAGVALGSDSLGIWYGCALEAGSLRGPSGALPLGSDSLREPEGAASTGAATASRGAQR